MSSARPPHDAFLIAGLLAAALLLGGCPSGGSEGPASPSALNWTPPPQSEWTPLFTGDSLTQWTTRSDAAASIWRVEDGVIDCSPRVRPEGVDKHLWSKRTFEDFRLRLEWRIKDTKGGPYAARRIRPDGTYEIDDRDEPVTVDRRNADSGIYLRGSSKAQVNIWNWPVGSGEVYGYRTDETMPPEVRAGVTPTTRADRPLGEWNTFLITMEGDRLTVTLNGTTVIENARLPDVPDSGPLALQHHGGYDDETDTWNPASSLVQFRDVYVREL
jgi:hypothetical protein